MRDNDSRLLAEAYQLILEGKALTPEQIAKQAKPAGSSKGGSKGGTSVATGGLATSNTEGKGAEQPSSNDAENIDQDNKDTTVKDPFVLKETDEAEAPVETSDEPAADVQGENVAPGGDTGGAQDPEAAAQELVYHAAMELTGTLESIAEQLASFPPEIARHAKVDLAMALKRIVDDFKLGRLPNQIGPNADPALSPKPAPKPAPVQGTERPAEGTPSNTNYGKLRADYRMDV
jgi:hypothetical protein